MKYLDPELLAKISSLKLRAHSVVEGLLSGLHSSPFKGHSLEFAQHRQYSFGDELRHIDWKVFGRSDRFFVKQFQDETNLRAYILVDASKSMCYKNHSDISKFEYAGRLASALSYLLLRQEDAVSLAAFDEELRFFIPPRNTLSHLALLTQKLESMECSGKTDIGEVLKKFGAQLKKRGLVIVISDLLSGEQGVLNALRSIKFRHHEVIAVQILDRSEIEFDFYGETKFVNMENEKNVRADAEAVKNEYRRLVKKFLDEYEMGFRQSGIRYHLITTDIPMEMSIAKCIS
jgi:uncharacterized protein (DUF58 family)